MYLKLNCNKVLFGYRLPHALDATNLSYNTLVNIILVLGQHTALLQC